MDSVTEHVITTRRGDIGTRPPSTSSTSREGGITMTPVPSGGNRGEELMHIPPAPPFPELRGGVGILSSAEGYALFRGL